METQDSPAVAAIGTPAPNTRLLRDLPGPRGLPLVGHTLTVDVPHLHLQCEQWAREFGPLYTLQLFGKTVLVVGETELMQEVFQNRPDDYRRISQIEPVFKELGTHGVFSAEGASWKVQRKLVMPSFSMRQQRALYPSVALHTERLRARWAKAAARGESVDVRSDLMRYTVDVTCDVVFGRDLNTLEKPDSDLQTHLSRIFGGINDRVNAPVPYWRWFKLPRDRALERSLRAVDTLLRSLIEEARAAITDPARAEAPRTLLEAMLVAQRDAEPDERLSDADVVGNVLTLLLAGEDTTSNTLAWMLHYAAHDSALQAQLRAEVDAVCAAEQSLPRYEDVVKLRHAGAVAQETLRLRSAAPLGFFEANRDVTLGGVSLPKGTGLFLLGRYSSLSERNFEDPSEFRPQRWLTHTTASACPAHQPRAMLAFGGGPRTCPGRSLALFECAMVLSMATRHFTLEPMSGRDAIDEIFEFTMQPRGIRVRFHAR